MPPTPNFPAVNVLDFLREILQRLRTKSPLFFRIVSGILLACGIVTGLPEFLDLFDIDIPQAFNDTWNKILLGASWVGYFVSSLTVDRTPPMEADNDEEPEKVLTKVEKLKAGKVLEAKRLPFTVKKEIQKIEKVKEDKKLEADVKASVESKKTPGSKKN